MKWTIIIVVFGTTPVPTNLRFDSLTSCWAREAEIRQEYINTFNEWALFARKNGVEQSIIDARMKAMEQIGVCVPFAP
jgi:hypothetical protein